MIARFRGSTGKYTSAEYRKKDTKPYVRMDQGLRVPLTGDYVQLKSWDQLGKGDNKNPFPQIFNPSMGLLLRESKDGIWNPQGKVYEYVELTDEYMQFLYDFWDWNSQYRLSPHGKIEGTYKRPGNFRTFYKTTPGSVLDVYRYMTEAHVWATEGGSREAGSRDSVMKVNLDADENIKWLYDPMGLNLLKRIGSTGTHWLIEAIDTLKPPPSIAEVASKPHWYFWCNQWGKYSGATRFPQIANANAVNGLPAAGTASPLFSRGGVIAVAKKSCNVMQNGAPWSPYRPK